MPANRHPLWKRVWLVATVVQARLRFVVILIAIGLVITNWIRLNAWWEKLTRPAGETQTAGSDTEYFCPMHPSVVRDKPGEKCPICFMPLSKRKKSEGQAAALPPCIVSRVQLSPYRIALAGIQTTEIGYQALNREITTVGFVEFDERKQRQIAARVKGRIDKLYVDVTGQMVHSGDELASIYSPDLVVTVQNLLDAQRSGSNALMRSARERLRLWDISDDQIDDILKTGKANTHLKIRSPMSGHVIRKYQVEGKYVDEGTPLYDLADLSTVWIQAQVYEDDLALLKEGLTVNATTPAFPARVFTGKLAFVHPHLDQRTRTLTVRFDMTNRQHDLRPGMYTTVKIQVPVTQLGVFGTALTEDWRNQTAVDLFENSWFAPAGPAHVSGLEPLLYEAGRRVMLGQGFVLVVPESAVIDTGSRKIVYRQIASEEFEGVEVELGPRCELYYPVVRGLRWGDRIVTNGSFLIDAETRLNPAAGSIYFGGSGSKTSQTATPVRPSTPSTAPTPQQEDKEILANLARLSPADRSVAEAQRLCPVSNQRLGDPSMGVPAKIMIQGTPVFLCCDGCKEDATKKPSETLAKVEKLKKTKSTSPRE